MSTARVAHILQTMPASTRLALAINILRVVVDEWESLVDALGTGDPRARALANAADEVGCLTDDLFADIPRHGCWHTQLSELRTPLEEVWGRVDVDLRQVDWALKELVYSGN